VLSAFMCILSVAILGLTIRLYTSELFSQVEGGISDFGSRIFTVLLIFSIVAFVMSIMGFVAARVEKKIFAIIYGSLLFIVIAVYISTGFFLAVLSHASDTAITQFCETGEADKSGSLFVQSLHDYISEADSTINTIVSSKMCTKDYCPCPIEYKTTWDTLGEEKLNKYGRTARTTNTQYEPLYFMAATDKVVTYNSFKECYTAITDSKAEDAKAEEKRTEFAKIKAQQKALSLMTYLEKSVECSGFC